MVWVGGAVAGAARRPLSLRARRSGHSRAAHLAIMAGQFPLSGGGRILYPGDTECMTNRNPNRPRFTACDFCGRNAHKLAVRVDQPGGSLRGTVLGVCPQCWHGAPGKGLGVAAKFTAAQVVFDNRTRKLPVFIGVVDGECVFQEGPQA